MDPLRLLSRSTKLPKKHQTKVANPLPSAGQNATPQLFGETHSRKRKRGQEEVNGANDEKNGPNFFGDTVEDKSAPRSDAVRKAVSEDACDPEEAISQHAIPHIKDQPPKNLSLDDAKSILRQHKLKISWLNAETSKRTRKKPPSSKKDKVQLFPSPLQDFSELHSRFGVSRRIVQNIREQGYTVPTEVQLGSLPMLLGPSSGYLSPPFEQSIDGIDLLTVAPTGSGKTLAFMIPLLHQAFKRKRDKPSISAIIMAPTKELVGQIVNEGRKLVSGTGLKITQVRRGMQFVANGSDQTTVKADIIVSTPGLLQSTIEAHEFPSTALEGVEYLVLDEADVLLDPLFRDQTLGVWNALSNVLLRTSLWSATMGSNIEELTRGTIMDRQHHLETLHGRNLETMPRIRLVVGLKDSAVPNVEHRLTYAASEQGKLLGLRQMLHPTSSSSEPPSVKPPFLVFTQTIERAVALHSELLYDIPVEAGGIARIAVLHSDLSDTARDNVMTRFRKGEIWVLITTDLLSRGVDFRGINGVVNYDIPTSSAAYVHRVGRTGRAGRQGGVAVTLYSKEDIPYLKHVANVVAMAEKQSGGQSSSLQSWLFDALPTLSKQEKQKFKRRGVDSRTSRGQTKDPVAARRSRISTKAGFARRQENNRKAAKLAGQQQKEQGAHGQEESEFEGFS